MGNSREQILLTTCDLLENQGFHGTGLNEIVRDSGAPKGSIYYYFPEGKEEIVAEALRLAGQRNAENTRVSLAEIEDAPQAILSFLETIAFHVEASGFRSGGPLTIVASETATTHERINQACQEAYNELREAFVGKLRLAGIAEEKAISLAWTINAAIEGAIILSRTFHTGNPLREAGRQLACPDSPMSITLYSSKGPHDSEGRTGMKLTMFGATGRTGQHLLAKALEEGHQVTVLVRDPAKVTLKNNRLAVVKGSLKDAVYLNQAIMGAEAVLSVLGPANNQPTFEISQGTQGIINAMKINGVKRLIVSAGAGVADPEDAPKLFNHLISLLLKATSRYVYEDMLKTVAVVRESGLDWTVVRVPMLTDGPATGRVYVGMVGKGMGSRISRADMAGFLLQQVNRREFIGKAPAISN